MTRDECQKKLAALSDEDLRDLLSLLCDHGEYPGIAARDDKIALCAAEIEMRPFASMLVPTEGETSRDPSAVTLALARWQAFGPMPDDWVARRARVRQGIADTEEGGTG